MAIKDSIRYEAIALAESYWLTVTLSSTIGFNSETRTNFGHAFAA